MSILLVVNNPERWPLRVPGVELMSARRYLTDHTLSERRGLKVFNLCRSYAYQSLGYYVSLLAEARAHRPQPSIETIQGMKSQAVVKIVSEELEDLVQRALQPVRLDEFVLSIYFGRSLARRHQSLALALFNQFQAPLLRARFERGKEGWQIASVRPIPVSEIPESHRESVVAFAQEYFQARRFSPRRTRAARYDLALLWEPGEPYPPSNEKALAAFERAGARLGLRVERITKDDYGRLSEFDALFIRVTTSVDHYTYRFARRAAASGLVVIDDAQSIARAANKVFQAEALERAGIPIPKTLIVHEDNVDRVAPELGLPCVLKQPDSAFSQGVRKVETVPELEAALGALLAESDLVVAQAYVPTEFDWRVGVLDGRALYACRYYMAEGHWQIIKDQGGERDYGKVETVPIESAPWSVVRAAVRSAALFGDGLYGVDLKQFGRQVAVVEVNDNPSIDCGFEDAVLGAELYERVLRVFLERIERKKAPFTARRRGRT